MCLIQTFIYFIFVPINYNTTEGQYNMQNLPSNTLSLFFCLSEIQSLFNKQIQTAASPSPPSSVISPVCSLLFGTPDAPCVYMKARTFKDRIIGNPKPSQTAAQPLSSEATVSHCLKSVDWFEADRRVEAAHTVHLYIYRELAWLLSSTRDTPASF